MCLMEGYRGREGERVGTTTGDTPARWNGTSPEYAGCNAWYTASLFAVRVVLVSIRPVFESGDLGFR